MSRLLRWKRDLLGRQYKLFSGPDKIGELKQQTWSKVTDCEIGDQKYAFVPQGSFTKKEAQIFDAQTKESIGAIIFKLWRNGAFINLKGKKYNWNYNSFTHGSWSVSEENEEVVFYDGTSQGGDIRDHSDSELVVLTGLFIKSYFSQKIGVLVLIAIIVAWIFW
ncbi:MAG TPA: hypothetical protein VKA27_14960 [Sunxiuqinia sp.]|nr:hypothetical protein [Sunxiuqinia sp.]